MKKINNKKSITIYIGLLGNEMVSSEYVIYYGTLFKRLFRQNIFFENTYIMSQMHKARNSFNPFN